MKPTIILEGMDDVAVLRALLPANIVDACELRPTGGRSTLVSVARTHMIKHHAPVAILLDTDTLDPTVIAETVQTTRHLMQAVAGDIPFEVFYCIPHIEAVVFEDAVEFPRIFPQFEDVFILQFAKTQPKEQLEVLFAKGGGPRNFADFLSSLTSDEVNRLQSLYPIQPLIAFIAANRDAVTRSN
jgi:hypothetical protein